MDDLLIYCMFFACAALEIASWTLFLRHLPQFFKEEVVRAENVLDLAQRVVALEEAVPQLAEAESARMAALGRRGVQVREENKEMRQAAMGEIRVLAGTLTPELLTNPQKQADLKGKVAALAQKYPKVADEVASQAFREFNIGEPWQGMIKGIIAEALLKPAAPTQGEEGGFYGL
jgi:hypothetical protein